MPDEDDEDMLFDTVNHPHVYVYWKQAEPAPFEIDAIHRADRWLHELSIDEVAAQLRAEDWWVIGPFTSEGEASRCMSDLAAAGLDVQLKWL